MTTPNLKQILADHQKMMDTAQAKYERTMQEAMARMESMALAAEIKIPEDETEETQTVPAAVWTTAPDGEQLMILNQAAATMFLALFEQLGEVLGELTKK